MYLAGEGYQKIKKQLEYDRDLTAMGKSIWSFSAISSILKNRLYCGQLEYRKEYIPDYLEQKRAPNNGEVERVIVEGRHQPIVSKEEFKKVQKIMEQKSPILGKGIMDTEKADVLKDKADTEEKLKRERDRYNMLLEMRMNNEIPKEVFYTKREEVESKIAELERRWRR